MKRRYHYMLWMLLLMLLTICAAAPAAAEEAAYQGDYTAVQTGPREFDVTFSAWTDESVSGELKPATIMLLVDVSNDSMFLAEAPGSDAVYKAGTSTKSMDENTVLYTLYDGAYREVRLFENKWRTVEYKDGEGIAGSRTVGTRSEDGGTDSFFFPVYRPDNGKTRLFHMKEAAIELIQETAVLSPGSKIGLIFFGDSLHVTEPVTLTEDNVKTLTETVSGCESFVSGGAQNIAALKEAARLLETEDENFGRGIVNISTGLAIDAEEADTAQRTAQDIRMESIKIYAAGLYEETPIKEEGKVFIEDISSPGFAYLCSADGLDDVLEKYKGDFLAGGNVTVAAVLDPRFTLSDTERTRLKNEEAALEIRDDGVTVIEWRAGMPRSQDSAWTATVHLSVKLDFPGGNDIPVCMEGSGIYNTGAQVYSFVHRKVNVGMDIEMYDFETKIFLGQRVPTMFGSDGLQSRMVKNSEPNWYGMGETGSFTYFWQEKSGGKIGQKEQLQEVTPAKDQTYVLTMTYTPKTDGRTAAGEAVQEMQNSAEYLVEVQSGTIRIKMVLGDKIDDDSAGDFYIFRLESEGTVQYRTLNMKDRSEDGQGFCLETAFTGLPYGKYTVSRVYSFESAAEISADTVVESECMIGYQEGSDNIDVDASEFTVVTKTDRTEKKTGKACVQTATCTYSIDFSEEGKGDV